MQRVEKIFEKSLALKLRSQGLSYRQILTQVKVSKDTLSRWCKEVSLTEKQKDILTRRQKFGQNRGSQVAGENRRLKRLDLEKKIFKKGKSEIGKLSLRDKFIAGLFLYIAEGDQTSRSVSFSSSNPSLILFMYHWLRNSLGVSKNKIRAAIWLPQNNHPLSARKYWASLLTLPITQFQKTYIYVPKKKSKKVSTNIKHPNGVLTLRIYDVNLKRKIKGWMEAGLMPSVRTFPNQPGYL